MENEYVSGVAVEPSISVDYDYEVLGFSSTFIMLFCLVVVSFVLGARK